MERIRCPWMHDLMVALQEISADDVALFRSAEQASSALALEHPAVADGSAHQHPAVADGSSNGGTRGEDHAHSEPIHKADLTLKALTWSTALKDHALVTGLAGALPACVLEEQVRLYEARQDIAPVRPGNAVASPFLVHPHLLKSRTQAAAAFHQYLLGEGWVETSRIPRGACGKFLGTMVRWADKSQVKVPCRTLRRWHAQWQKDLRLQHNDL